MLIKSLPPQRDWWVKLSDFGISKRIEGSTAMLSSVKGTPQYMAPELASCEPGRTIQIDQRAGDMWSLGEMVHRMLTAAPTFPSYGSPFNYMIWPNTLPFQELAKHSASSDVESFIRALMKPAPEHRLTSAQAIEHAWVRHCKPSKANHPPSRTFTLAYAIFIFSSCLDSLVIRLTSRVRMA